MVQWVRSSVERVRRRQNWLGWCFAVGAVALVSGCAVGPDFPPPAPDVSGYTPKPLPAQTVAADDAAGAAQRFAIGRDIPGDWWRLFGSGRLKAWSKER